MKPGEKQPGPGHVPTEVVAAEARKIETPASKQRPGPGPLMTKHEVGVDLIAAKLETEVIHVEARVHHSHGGVEHPVALLLVERDPGGVAGERSGG
jgi:hypothetical protein